MAPNWFIAFSMQVEGLRFPQAPPPRVRVFAAADLHVTLGFLGAVQEADARKAWDLIGEFGSLRQVTGSFSGIEALGHPRKPSALSAMIDSGREPLAEMIDEVRAPLLEAAGAREDTRPPLPHMTFARIQRRAKSAERRDAIRWAQAIEVLGASFMAPSVALYTRAEDRRERLFQIVERHELAC